MKTSLLLTAASLLPLVSLRPLAEDNPEVGSVPPEIDAAGWFNHLGPPPTLAGLKGQTVLIEFWATWCPPCRAAWPHLQELHEEYESKGLVILGLSDEEPDVVSAFLDDMGITARVGYGSKASDKYGVEGIPHTFVVGPNGKLAWHGHPAELDKGTLEGALKGAKPRTGGALALTPRSEAAGRLGPIAQAMEQGKLAKALQAAKAIDGDAKSTEAEKTGAAALAQEVLAHVKALAEQAERYVSSKDVARAIELYGLIAKELAAEEPGKQAKARSEAIRKDPELARELEAAEGFARLRQACSKLATSKRRDKYREFAEKYEGTRAAERARAAALSKNG